jgi:hypothetical protein
MVSAFSNSRFAALFCLVVVLFTSLMPPVFALAYLLLIPFWFFVEIAVVFVTSEKKLLVLNSPSRLVLSPRPPPLS